MVNSGRGEGPVLLPVATVGVLYLLSLRVDSRVTVESR